jgi:hypothetical protein
MLLFVLASSAMAAGIVSLAAAQNYPWCEYLGGPGGSNCGFVSLEQCMESASGTGSFYELDTLVPAYAATIHKSQRVGIPAN